MSLRRNKSGGPLQVSFLDLRTVEADEVAELPDFQADGVSPIVWPGDKWEPVAEPKARKSRAKPEMAVVIPPPEPAADPAAAVSPDQEEAE